MMIRLNKNLPIFFDIGATLMEMPMDYVSPVKRILEKLIIEKRHGPALCQTLMASSVLDKDQIKHNIAFSYDRDSSTVSSLIDRIWEEQLTLPRPVDGAKELVSLALNAGYQVAFISNIWKPYAEAFENLFPETDHCDKYYSFIEGTKKPERDIYRLARKKHGVGYMVGDTFEDDIVPSAIEGFTPIWVLNRPHKERDSLIKYISGTSPIRDVHAVRTTRDLIKNLNLD